MSRIAVITFLMLAWLANAQVTGRITGSVIDPTGSALPRAKVSLFLGGGTQAVASTETGAEGLFSLESIRPEVYDLLVEAPGFQSEKVRSVKVDPSRATDLAAIRLEIATATATVEVTAGAETVQLTVTDISTTVTADQILRLPVSDRDPLGFISTQAGVSNAVAGTAINGQRVSASDVSLAGINIQDTFIKDNGLTYTPNQLLLDQVEEFTVTTSNATASHSGGSGVNFTIPSGGNSIHGAVYWQNRNNAFAANTWFNNTDGIRPPRLNLNNVGGRAGGPIQRDRLFYYVNYEASRLRSEESVDQTILTADARQGIFTYRSTSGQLVKANILNIVGLKPDPLMAANLAQVPGPEKINNFRVGDSQQGQLLNTAGYSFLARANRDRDNVTSRLDYSLSTRHTLEGNFVWNRDAVDRPDAGIAFNPVGPFRNDNTAKLLAVAWRWSPSAAFTNELRGGFNFSPGYFIRTDTLPQYFIGGTIWSSPVVQGQPQGRETRTYNLQDNATWTRGRHTIQFGYYFQPARTYLYDYFGTIPTYNVGIDSVNQQENLLFPADLRGISATDFDRANLLLASLAGLLDNGTATYHATSRTSGFVNGAPFARNWRYDNHAFYIEDKWKAARRVSVTAGLRWDYYTPVDERDALALQPILIRGDARATMLSNATLYFSGNAVQRPFYKQDFNNFGPNIGVAWDVFGNGKTSFRAGYSIKYVSDQQTTLVSAYSATNAGLTASVGDFGLSGTMSSGRPTLAPPRYFIPRTFADNYALDPTSFSGLIDPALRTPYVQEFTASIQHEWKGTIIEGRYIGNHATKMTRGFDYNQIDIRSSGFLDDFLRAQNNGNLARNATGVFNPAYDPRIPGSQVLRIFPQILGGGFLSNSTVRTLIDRGEAAELGLVYLLNGINGNVRFYPNQNTLASLFVTNFANSRYDSLQLEARHRYRRGMQFQVNYTFSKWLGNTAGVEQLRYEPFMDVNNPGIEKSRSPFDLTHQFKANYVYDLPFGLGHRIQSKQKWVNKVIEGWSSGGVIQWQSGNPFSIASQRGTFLPEFYSGVNEANTIYNKGQLEGLVTFQKTPSGPYMVPLSAIGADGRGVAPDGQKPFQGQLFTNPGAGQFGALQRRFFTGPSIFAMDASVQKEVSFRDRYRAQLRMEALNVFNHPTFYTGAQNINSTQFGRISLLATDRRRLQLALRINF
jgi:hypothetical protein